LKNHLEEQNLSQKLKPSALEKQTLTILKNYFTKQSQLTKILEFLPKNN